MRTNFIDIRVALILISVSSFVSCSSTPPKRTVASEKSSHTVNAPTNIALDEDADLEEIDEISQLPKTDHDLQAGQDLVQIPIEINSLVVKWVDYFQGRGRKHMERYLSRSSRYLPMMKKVLKDRGLPEDLVYVALIESGFSPIALSRVGAVGYWQFMRGTGRDYGLKINSHIDERRDPVLSTLAAADYFSGLYNLFGSWYLAIASYNAGENKIKRLIMTHHTRDFWELIRRGRMPVETINYVPKFIAASLIAKNPGKYGFRDIEYAQPFAYDEIKIQGTISLHRLANKLNMTYDELKALNPAFKTDFALAARGSEYTLRVPVGRSDAAGRFVADSRVRDTKAILSAGHSAGGPTYIRHKVKKGESLTEIAGRYNVSIAQIAKASRLSPRSSLLIGQNLLIPQGGVSSRAGAELKHSKSVLTKSSKESATIHVVKKGETLAAIARKYRVSMGEITNVNGIKSRSRILVGDRINIPN